MAFPDVLRFVEFLEQAAQSHADVIVAEVKALAPVYRGPDPRKAPGAGKYRDDIGIVVERTEHGLSMRITGPNPLTDWIIGGTEAHEIVAVNVGTLMFYLQDGTIMFRRRVMHPGTAPNPFYEQAMPTIHELEGFVIDDALAAWWSS